MFAFRLALALGYPHPDYLMDQITSRQFVDWMAFERLDPIGGQRGDIQAGVIASVIANVNRDTKKQKKPFSITDFMPFVEKKPSNPIAALRQHLRSLKKDGK